MKTKLSIFFMLMLSLMSCNSIEPIKSCDPIGNAHPLCGWQNPEDMAALPDGRHVIVSEYGGMNGEKSGTLSLLSLQTKARKVLFRGDSSTKVGIWGDPSCISTPGAEFSPHGIHLSHRKDGTMQLLVVQHGGRESVEMFEVAKVSGKWSLIWRGCVIAPLGSMFNDVVATPEGGFLVTHMMPRSTTALGNMYEFMKVSLFGVKSGHVLAWHPTNGFRQLANSEGAIANGIEISPDGKTVFVNYSLDGEVRRINRINGKLEARTTALPPLDNSTWSLDGRLLVAGALADPMEMLSCEKIESGSCPGAFAIIAVDPQTFESETIYEGGPNTPSGAGTVGLQMRDGSLLIGTFAGDRIVRVLKDE